MEKKFYRQAFVISLPVLAGYLALGTAFGVLFARAGFHAPLAALMSLTVYGGSMQFAAVDMLAAHMGFAEIALLSILINIRHIVYGFSLFDKFRAAKKWKYYLIFTLTDETYALLVGTPIPAGADPGKFMAAVACFDHLYWIAGGVIGTLAGGMLDFDARGIEFTMPALFAVILVEQCRNRANRLPALLGFAATFAARWGFGTRGMLVPAMLAIAGGLFVLRPYLTRRGGQGRGS